MAGLGSYDYGDTTIKESLQGRKKGKMKPTLKPKGKKMKPNLFIREPVTPMGAVGTANVDRNKGLLNKIMKRMKGRK